jgi:hypothetical protein
VCFFYKGDSHFDADGECYLEPPKVFLAHDAGGEVTFLSMRPTVGSQEFCRMFSHKAEKPPTRGNQVAEEPE